MITPDLIMRAEDNLMCHCANRVKTTFGCLFYNDENRESHDCNHALIYDLSDPRSALAQIEGYYTQKCLTPRIYCNGRDNEYEILKPIFDAEGWKTEYYGDREIYLYTGGEGGMQTALKIKRCEELDSDVYNAFVENDGGGEWCAKAAVDSVRYGKINVFAGYEDGRVASSVSVEHDSMTGLALVQDVFTLERFRGKGYARDMMRYALTYEKAHEPGYQIYLWVENPIAKRLYRDVGFVPAEFSVPNWEAYKPLPDGMNKI